MNNPHIKNTFAYELFELKICVEKFKAAVREECEKSIILRWCFKSLFIKDNK